MAGQGPPGADCAAPDFTVIQTAINNAAGGDNLLICQGVYQEQLDVDRPLSLIGAGNETVIRSPATGSLVSRYSLSGFQYQPVVHAGADDLTIRGLQVDGDRQGNVNGTFLFLGISGLNRDGLVVRDTHITRIQKTPFDGVQTGFAVRLDNTDGVSRTVVIDGNLMDDYQKGAIVVRGLGLDGTVTDNRLYGVGSQTDIAQNGISFGRGMSGLIEGNEIRSHKCNHAPSDGST